MTSSRGAAAGCYVFIYLPDDAMPVVCGRFEQQGDAREPIGLFTYARSYLGRSDAVPIDPVSLPLRAGTFPPTARLGGVYGPLRDAAPDAWGRRVIEYARGTRDALSEVEYLLAAGDDRTGALAFGEEVTAPASSAGHHKALPLEDLLAAAEQVDADVPPTEATRRAAELLLDGPTMGGARPKASVIVEGAAWMAKFPGRADRFNMAAAEAGLLTLASRCGIAVPEHRTVSVAGRPVLLVRRFDRRGVVGQASRARYLSGLTLLDADELPSSAWSYLLLAEEIRRRSASPDADRRELYRRIVFNALVSNADDHPRNHAIVAFGADDWRLAPAFDLVPMPQRGARERRLAMIAGRAGRVASRENIVSGAAIMRVDAALAARVVDEMKAIVAAHWEADMRAHGAGTSDLASVRDAILPAGFEDPIP